MDTPTAAPAGIDVESVVLGIVAEQTGYPPDLLATDLDLEADLGIDTVKQAEVFASIRQHFDIPRDDNLKLRDYPTLAHVIGFVQDRAATPTSVEAPAAPAKASRSRSVTPDAAALAAGIAAADSVPRRVPVPVLRPPLQWCAPTGVEIGSGSRVVIMADTGGTAAALVAKLAELGAAPLLVDDAPDAQVLTGRIDRWLTEGAIQGVYWLPALDDEGPTDRLDAAAWHEGLRIRVKLLYATVRHLLERSPAAPPFLVTATRLGGRHGCEAVATAPMGGAVTGFAKAYRREQPTALVKAVDFDPGADPASISGILVEETRRDPGCVETGHRNGQRVTISLDERPARAKPGAEVELGPDSVFVVTGAAGGIVSAIVADLATASGGVFHLLDLIPEPDRSNPDLARLATDKDGLRRDVADRLKTAGERPTPVLIERELSRLERQAAGLDAIRAVEAAGGEAHWHQVNLTDAEGVAAAITAAAAGRGRIDVLVHAAGLEISRMLSDKIPTEFDLVFDVKADGWFHLLQATRAIPVGSVVVFSSVAGRFGNGGQTDYSAANDLLCKSMSALGAARPDTRALAIDWTAWAGIGMATRGSIPKMMELAGIDMLQPEAGVPTVRREIVTGARGEIVVGRRLGIMTDELHPTGGLDAAGLAGGAAFGPMAARVTAAPVYGGLVVETPLDPAERPFLHDHRIDGTPVLPGVMGIEAFAEAASLLTPGWHVEAVEDVEFLAPFKFYRDEPRTVVVDVRAEPVGDDVVIAACRLIGRRALAGGQEQETVHFTGTVRLSRTAPPAPDKRQAPHRNGAVTVGPAAIYQVYFHGPAYQVLSGAWRDGDTVVGEFADGLPADGGQPPTGPSTGFLMAPRLMELCFQTAGMWQLGRQGLMGLPRRVGRVTAFGGVAGGGPPVAGLEALVTPTENGFDAEVLSGAGDVLIRMSGYETVELPTPMEDGLIVPLRAAMS